MKKPTSQDAGRAVTESDTQSYAAPPDVARRVREFLRALPYLTISETGKRNVCRRFGVTEAEFDALLNDFEHEHTARRAGRHG